MFLSVHDLNLLLVALGFGVGLGVVLAVAIADPLAGDLRRIKDTADRVAEGDLEARTGVDRPDEVGAAAAAIDGMVAQLAEAEQERTSPRSLAATSLLRSATTCAPHLPHCGQRLRHSRTVWLPIRLGICGPCSRISMR